VARCSCASCRSVGFFSWFEALQTPYTSGYLSRSVPLLDRHEPADVGEGEDYAVVESEQDSAALDNSNLLASQLLTQQDIVYSPTFQIPTFYFTVGTART
jgi:hypothetical protein